MEFQANIGDIFRKLIPSFLLAIVIAIAVSFFFIITLKWSAAFVFWGFVGVVMTLLATVIVAAGVVLGQAANNAQDKKKAEEAKVCLSKWVWNFHWSFGIILNFLKIKCEIFTIIFLD